MKVLGIDPGTTRIGYGLIETNGWQLISYGVLEIKAREDIDRIKELGERLEVLIRATKPDIAGVERVFFGRNKKTGLAVSQARGVILSFLAQLEIPVYECRPIEVKMAVTGYGAADKIAVATMVKKTLNISTLVGYDDASDALAIAITTAAQQKLKDRIPR